MITNWDELLITIVDPDSFLVTEDEHAYSLRAEQRMIVFAGEPGLDGKDGEDGKSITPVGPWTPNLEYHYLDLVYRAGNAYVAKQDVPIGVLITDENYWMLTVTGGEGGGGGITSVSWGDINGTLANQTDLQTALSSKANTSDLGDLAYEDDAPSDNAEYVRKNGSWAVSSGGGGSTPTWGSITGTMSQQTDLQTALDEKAPVIIDRIPVTKSGVYVVVSRGEEIIDLKATYNVTQTGSGTPSASNIRPFVSTEKAIVMLADSYSVLPLFYESVLIQLPSTIYGGIVDVINGELTITHGHIASYNGETLSGVWYSDRDEYVAGTTPTVGAEVVYELETPVHQSFTGRTPRPFQSRDTYMWVTHAQNIETNYTVTAIVSNEGAVDTKTYIDQKDALKANVSDLGDLAYEDDAPSDNVEYVRKNGTWAVSSGGGGGGGETPVWGTIIGTLSQQTDLKNALDAKANTADLGALADHDAVDYQTEVTNKPSLGSLALKDSVNYATEVTNKPSLGTMSSVNDAPSDSKEYVRKNGTWAEKSDSVSWGDVSGTLANQTDLQSALDTKADEADLGALASKDTVDYVTEVTNKPTFGSLASKDTVDYATEVTNKPSAFPPTAHTHDDRYYTESEVDALLADKADTSDLGDLATLDSIDYTSNKLTNKPTLGAMASQSDAPSDSKEYVRKNGAWSEATGVAWGDVTGTLTDQTDLATALNGKQNVLTIDSTPTAGSTNPVESGGVKTALDTKVSKSGDTMTGHINLSNTRIHANSVIDEDAPPSSGTLYYAPYEIYDADNNKIGHIEISQNANGKLLLSLGLHKKVNSSWVWKQLTIGVDSAGNMSYSFGDAEAARNGLGAVAKSGDTMTGNLVLEGASNVVGLGINVSGESGRGSIFRFAKTTDSERIYLYQFKNNNTNYDLFRFPHTDPRETSNNTYELLSTKAVVTVEQGGTGNVNGTVAKLTTARTIRTNLGSTSTASFDGSANVTPGVTGTLGLGNGGTGGTDSGWKSLTNSSVYTGTIYYRKIGQWVFISTHGAIRNVSEVTSSDLTLCSIPEAYRPNYNYAGTLKTNTMGLMADAFINAASGGLTIRARIGNTIPANAYLYMSFMYFI